MSHPLRSVEGVSRRPWNPWRALRERRHLRLVYAELPRSCGGGALVEEPDGSRRVMLDFRLDQTHRNAALAHELVHDERVLLPLDGPVALRAKEEEHVRREVARRLIPSTLLARYVARVAELGEPVHAASVAHEFDVPLDVAQRALWLLEQERRAG